MNFCQKCGAKIDAHVKFCPSCGTKVGNDTDKAPDNEERMETLSNIERPSVKSKRDVVKTSSLHTTKPKRRKRKALKLFMSGILVTVVLVMIYIFFIQPSDNTEAEVNEITFAQAAGYWISYESSQKDSDGHTFTADQLNLSLYLDEDYVVIASNGEENVEVYSITEYEESEDNSSLDLLVKDAEDNNRTLSLLSPTEDIDSFTMKLDDEETVEILSVSEEEYKAAGGLDLRKEAEAISETVEEEDTADDIEIAPEEPVEDKAMEDLTYDAVIGYYVSKNEEGDIDFIYYIEEDHTSQISIHPINKGAAAYSASLIDGYSIEDNVVTLDVMTSDHNLMRDNDYFEHTMTWHFDTATQPLSFDLNESGSELTYMELQDILDEFDGELNLDLEEMLDSLIDDVLNIIEDDDGGNFSVIGSDETEPESEIDQDLLDAEYTPGIDPDGDVSTDDYEEEIDEEDDGGNFSF